jgi:poly(3-hydroxybutyrate) depolymerase
MKITLIAWSLLLAARCFAATDVRVDFTLNTTDRYGNPIQQQRYYYVYRPDGLSKAKPVPLVMVLEASAGSGPATFFRDIAGKAGFVVVSCSFSGNSTGTPGSVWTADDPRISGWEDFDYLSEVMRQVAASQNAGDAFMTGISKAGHMTQAYACERPQDLRAAAPLDEFMGLTSNIPTAPVPLIMFQGTLDTNVPYTMVKDSVDVWRAVNRLLSVTPVTTYESSPLIPGKVTRATWRPDASRPEVAMVTIAGGTHTYPSTSVQTGYDYPTAVWGFFSRYLSDNAGAPRIAARPVDNVQQSGMPASFRVTALGDEPLQYQWQRNGVDMPGATADWYTLPAATPADDGATFRAIVTNAAGTATSETAKLKVLAATAGPSIDAAPTDQVVVAGQTVRFTVSTTSADPPKYQWRKNGLNIAGATAAEYDIPAAISADSGATFSVAVTNGSGSAASIPATLTVTPAPGAPIILVNPARVRTVPEQTGSFSVTAWSLTPMTYQWQKGGFTTTMVEIPGATDSIYTMPSPVLADHLTMFRCIVSNAAGNATSASEMLFVTAAPVKPAQMVSPLAAAVQVGMPFQYRVAQSGGTAPLVYSAAPLPDGLTLDPATGIISGVPTTVGNTQVTIGAANMVGNVSEVLTISVTADPPAMALEAWRRATFLASATDPTIAGDSADPDGDGFTNVQEFQAGTNPLDPASTPPPPPPSPPAGQEANPKRHRQ